MSGAYLSYKNVIDTSALSLNAGTAVAGYPLANCQVRQLSTVTRLNVSGTPVIQIDMGAVTPVDVIAILAANFVPNADQRNYSTMTWSANGSSWNTGSLSFANDLGNGNLPNTIIGKILTQVGGRLTTARYIRIVPGWPRIGSATYYEFGRLWIAPAIEIPDGCDQGWNLSYADPGSIEVSAGGQVYSDPRLKGRVLSMPCGRLLTDVAYGFADDASVALNVPSLDDMFATVGTTGEVLVCHKNDSPIWMRRTGIYGHLTEDSLKIQNDAGPYHSVDITVIEEH